MLQQAVIDHIHEQWEDDFARVNARRHQTRETGHGREETRSYIQMPVPEDVPTVERGVIHTRAASPTQLAASST